MMNRAREKRHVLFHHGLAAVLAAGMVPGAFAGGSIVSGREAPPPVGRRVPAAVTARLSLAATGPGPMIRVFEGDRVALEIVHPPGAGKPRALHLSGPGGGDPFVDAPPVAPGATATLSFEARRPGLYLYRAEPEDPAFSGLLLVEPTYGFRHADREFFIVLGMDAEQPEGDGGFTCPPGGRVRLFVGHPGAAPGSLTMTGQITGAALVQEGLSVSLPETRVDFQAGETAILELEIGDLGEVELLVVTEGKEEARAILRVEEVQEIVQEEPPAAAAGGPEMTPELQAKIVAGKEVFGRTCIACHQATGLGIPGVYPPLAQSDYLLADVDRAIRGVIKGQQGEIVVNGKKYNMLMPPQMLSDEEIAQVLTYVLHSWGNPGEDVAVERVKTIREKAQ